MKGKETTYARIESTAKAVRILEFLATQKEPATGPQVARAVDIALGTVMNQIVTLQDFNMVRSVGNGYELGMGAALLWARKKALLEGERRRIDQDIQKLGED